MKRITIFLVAFYALISSQNLFASSITAVQDGNWGNTDTWGGAAVPDGTPCYDTIIIPAGIDVQITNTVNLTGCPPVTVIISGTLIFQNGKKLELPNGSVVWVQPGGYVDVGSGGGSSTYITIDGDQYWNAASGPLTGPAVLCQSCALPIELLNFTAELESGVVTINWQTASEEGNDFFWVQRSADGFTWENISWHDGAGNSSSLIEYSAEDRSPFLGISYYRLMQVDENGASSFSPTRVISNGQFFADQQLLVMSSASGNQHNVVIYFQDAVDGEVDLAIVGVNGTVLFTQKVVVENENWVVIAIDKPIATGVYVVRANQQIQRVFFQ